MSTTTRRIDTVQCDTCRKTEDNPRNWYTVHFAILPRNDVLGQPGFLNNNLNHQGWDFCSEECARTWRDRTLLIVKVSYR